MLSKVESAQVGSHMLRGRRRERGISRHHHLVVAAKIPWLRGKRKRGASKRVRRIACTTFGLPKPFLYDAVLLKGNTAAVGSTASTRKGTVKRAKRGIMG